MKKVVMFFALLFVAGLANKAEAQCIHQGTIINDNFYGFPNFGKTIYQSLEGEGTNFKATGYGPFGSRVEYMVADNFGIGIEFNMLGNGATFQDTVSVYQDTAWVTNTYDYEYKHTKWRFMARMSYHFVVTDMVDSYVAFGAGYKKDTYDFISNDPNGSDNFAVSGLIPFSARIAVGMRMFFTPWAGINFEIGAGGGPLVAAGASFKFL